MKIINHRNKDYYDYLCGTWGEDPLIVYDRKDQTVLDKTKLSGKWYDKYFYEKPLWNDVKRTHPKSTWQSNSFLLKSLPKGEQLKIFNNNYREGEILYIAIEVGKKIYIVEVDRYIDDDNPDLVHITPRLINKTTTEKRSDAPISIYPCRCSYWYSDKYTVEDIDIKRKIDNPILIKTWITRIIPAGDMWKELYEYLGSLKDKPIVDSRTNDEHIESNGFDKKISFRNVK